MPEFGAQELLQCYANGVFPMADSRDDPRISLVDPEWRGIIPLDGLKVSKSLAKTVRAQQFEIKINASFMDVVKACAAPRPGHEGTWINETICDLYAQLHALSHAHSIECWQGGRLVGGLYGINLGGAFFGESMFSHVRDASKVALVHLVGRLKAGEFKLLDTQFITEHLRSLGAIEVSREHYHEKLAGALKMKGVFTPNGYSDVDYSARVRAFPRQSSTQIS